MADNDFGAFADLVPQGALGPTSKMTNEQLGQVRGKLAAGRMLRRQLGDVEGLYNKTLKGTGIRQSLSEYLPSQANQRFDAAAKGLTLLGRQAFRVPGSGAESDKELEILLRAVEPNTKSFDAANEQRLSQLRAMTDEMERNYAPMIGEKPQLPPRAADVGIDDLIAEYQRRKVRR